MLKAIKISRDKEDYGYWAVQLQDEESGKYYWMDVRYDEKYHEIDIDWNQYIFYLTDVDDLERKEFQENCDNFDMAVSAVYDALISEGELRETDADHGGFEIATENWEEKTLEIRQ